MQKQIKLIKESRQRLDALYTIVKTFESSPELYHAGEHLRLGFMRLGLLLGTWGAEYPYPQSSNPENKVIEAPVDKGNEIIITVPDEEIARVKYFRKYIQEEVEKLLEVCKVYYDGASEIGHEALIAIDSLRDAKMYFGQELNNIYERDKAIASHNKMLELANIGKAKEAYLRYGAVTDFKNFQGNPMPLFDELPETIQKAWVAAVGPFNVSTLGSTYAMQQFKEKGILMGDQKQ